MTLTSLSKTHRSDSSVYVQANNPFVFTKYKGMDPEVGSSAGNEDWAKGIDVGYYPQARTMILGVNLKF